MANLSPLSILICENLADMQWHRREELIEVLIPTIPPGVAIRRSEHNRQKAQHSKLEGKPRVRQASTSDIIYSGARYIVVAAINSLTQVGRIEVQYAPRKEDTIVRMIRPLTDRGGKRNPKVTEPVTDYTSPEPVHTSKYEYTVKLILKWPIPIPENADHETIETLTHYQVKQIQKCLDERFGANTGTVQIALQARQSCDTYENNVS
jgi:hypothetical protein